MNNIQSNYSIFQQPDRLRFWLKIIITFLFFLTFFISEPVSFAFDMMGLIQIAIIFLYFSIISWIIFKARIYFDNYLKDKFLRFSLEFLVIISASILLTSGMFITPIYFFLTNQIPNRIVSDFEVIKLMFIQIYIFTVLLSLLMYVISSVYYLLLNTYVVAKKAEELKRVNLQENYELLSGQVNPHFLFNSLNALSLLIYQDKDKAGLFVDELSWVYRYVLEQKDKELVPLSKELKFLKSYFFLLKIRYRETIDIHFPEADKTTDSYHLSPLTLKILVDNALKYNIATKENPLKMTVELRNDTILTFSNIYQPRQIVDENTHIKLSYLVGRYKYLTEKTLTYHVTSNQFEVIIPLLEIE